MEGAILSSMGPIPAAALGSLHLKGCLGAPGQHLGVQVEIPPAGWGSLAQVTLGRERLVIACTSRGGLGAWVK